LVGRSHHGYLRILSGSGEILYDGRNTTKTDHVLELGGTLIAWQIAYTEPSTESADHAPN